MKGIYQISFSFGTDGTDFIPGYMTSRGHDDEDMHNKVEEYRKYDEPFRKKLEQ